MASEKRLIDAVRYREVLDRYINAPHVKMGCSYSGGMSTAINTCISFLDNQPTVDAVEVVHGRWEYGKWEQGHWVKGNERCRCSVCHRDFAADHLNIWNGCPHCLAKMDGERKDNE